MSRRTAFRDAESRGLALRENQRRAEMRNKLLATVAVAAVVGFGGFAAAQSQMGGESNKAPSGATSTQQKSGGGGMSGAQSGNKTLNPSSTQSSNPSRNQSAQEKSGKDNERLGQGQEQKGLTRGAQQEKGGMEQKGAQQERGLQKNQKGAQEKTQEKSSTKGAQQERGMQQRGAQQQQQPSATQQRGAQQPSVSGRGTTEQTGQAGVTGGARGGSVQLSEDQRSQIKTVIGRGSGPRLSRSDVSFGLSVGTRVPRSVHFVTLPSEIVRIIPQYRGFDYFLVEDEIVIVDPHTLEIVAVIPA
jgi:hypothetical protein